MPLFLPSLNSVTISPSRGFSKISFVISSSCFVVGITTASLSFSVVSIAGSSKEPLTSNLGASSIVLLVIIPSSLSITLPELLTVIPLSLYSIGAGG